MIPEFSYVCIKNQVTKITWYSRFSLNPLVNSFQSSLVLEFASLAPSLLLASNKLTNIAKAVKAKGQTLTTKDLILYGVCETRLAKSKRYAA